jgi:Domain of unknown function (DUF4159)
MTLHLSLFLSPYQLLSLVLVLFYSTNLTALEISNSRNGVPDWAVDNKHPRDAFTFVRLRYSSVVRGSGGEWDTDYPDSDLNFSWRLQQLTSLKVNPNPVVLEISEPELFNYPFVYMIEPGRLEFSEEEVTTLRRYLLSGGFLMVDDFWGSREYDNFYTEIKRVLPEREPQELELDHPIFHAVFDLQEKPQVPSIQQALKGRSQGITWQHGEDGRQVHYKGIFDDKGRMMVIICHNTDLGDGWEREGESEWYFHEFSEKKSYPMGVNIVFYSMTH